MLTWCTMPVPGGTTLNWLNACWPQRRKPNRSGVALVLELHVALERVRPGEHVGDHRVVDDQLGRDQRVYPAGVTAEVPHRLAHGRQVDDGGNAGQVLHDHPGRAELDLGGGLGGGVPRHQRRDLLGRDVHAVLGPQQVLQQDLEAEREVAAAARRRVQPVDLIAGVTDAAACRGCRNCWLSSHGLHRVASWAVALPGAPPLIPLVCVHSPLTASCRSRGFPAAPARPRAGPGRGGPGAQYLDVKLSMLRLSRKLSRRQGIWGPGPAPNAVHQPASRRPGGPGPARDSPCADMRSAQAG